ncbi:hypothetical protein BOTCAL_0589g00020 [Botryotinia calthae]|uniref:Uncharacterized protein n=1 Tax=Botryotinia calthae TaxID=38488 RepID=A0A4Y8CJ31_9HELO|nr:hypothetical protein BOTCAL_0589g00020 [Botryotinia calthae]
MTTNFQFRGENRMKKLARDKYGNPGFLTSESREVRELTDNMQAMGLSSGVNSSTNSRKTASSFYTSYMSNPSRSASSSQSRPAIDERPNASENYFGRSALRSSSSYQRADEYIQQPAGSASSRAAAGYGEASYREESGLMPTRSSDQRISSPSSGFSRGHERGRVYSKTRGAPRNKLVKNIVFLAPAPVGEKIIGARIRQHQLLDRVGSCDPTVIESNPC